LQHLYIYILTYYSYFTYLSLSKVLLIEIKKKDFYSILEIKRREEYLKDLKFYHSLYLYSDFSRNAIEKFKLNTEEKKFTNRDILINQGDPLEFIYIVKSGSFQVLYKLKKNITNEFDLQFYSSITPIDFRFTENNLHEIKGFKIMEENFKISTLEKGQFIGDLEFYHGKDKSYFSIYCISEGSTIIKIPIKVN
jgi:CRP-like cAMP-binding protein